MSVLFSVSTVVITICLACRSFMWLPAKRLKFTNRASDASDCMGKRRGSVKGNSSGVEEAKQKGSMAVSDADRTALVITLSNKPKVIVYLQVVVSCVDGGTDRNGNPHFSSTRLPFVLYESESLLAFLPRI